MAASDLSLSIGLRGTLTLDPWAGERWARGELEEDAFSLIAKRAAMLGHTRLAGEGDPSEHWGLGEVGGSWTQDGQEHLLAWLQAILPAGSDGVAPLQACCAVAAQALGHVGSLALGEVDAIVPLAAAPDPGRLAIARDWVGVAPPDAPRQELAVTVEAGGSALDPRRLATAMRDLGDPVIGDVRAVAELDAVREPPSFPGRSFSSRAVSLVAGVPSWSVDAGAWAAGLAAWACHGAGARGDVLVAVRVTAESPAAPCSETRARR